MTKTIPCNKCGGRGYFTYEQRCTAFCGIAVSRCEVCQGKGMVEVPVTNADHIRSMTDEELKKLIVINVDEKRMCKHFCAHKLGECGGHCLSGIAEWLRQPYKEATDD